MTYHLRRLRLHGLIERIPHTLRYVVTDFGLCAAIFLTRLHNRVHYPSMADLTSLDHHRHRCGVPLTTSMTRSTAPSNSNVSRPEYST